jgi:hypothetical protein
LLVTRQAKVMRDLRRALSDLRQQWESLEPAPGTPDSFATHLSRSEKQQSAHRPQAGSGADRYRYVASLAQQGMAAEEIAAALELAPQEVEQLLKLSRLKHQVAG